VKKGNGLREGLRKKKKKGREMPPEGRHEIYSTMSMGRKCVKMTAHRREEFWQTQNGCRNQASGVVKLLGRKIAFTTLEGGNRGGSLGGDDLSSLVRNTYRSGVETCISKEKSQKGRQALIGSFGRQTPLFATTKGTI